MKKEELEDDWWIIGNVESRMYLHWKGDGISGCFVDVCDPEDAERYDSADAASQAIQEDEDVQSEISTWNKPACPLHVRKGILVTDAAAEQPVDFMNPQQRRARLLYCMDVLMHAMNDEEASVHWLSEGVPDGTLEKDLTQEQIRPYLDLEFDDEEFANMAGVFIKTLANQGYYRPNRKTEAETGKAVFA